MSAIPRRISFGTAPKYHNKPTVLEVEGRPVKFASLKEARDFRGLQLLEAGGRIRELKRQVAFKIEIGGKPVCKYVADFTFEEYAHGEWHPVVADSKGYATPVYKLKRKLMAVVLGIVIREM
jgi:hypothetical protein